MPPRAAIRILGRRDFLAGASAAAAVATLAALPCPAAAEAPAPHSQAFKDAYKTIVGDAVPAPDLVLLDLPEYAENGNGVSFTLSVDSPMIESNHVSALHLLSTANPHARVATYRFTPASGKAQVTGRMRLAATQDVIAVAELSNGTFLIGERTIGVSIGGCDN